MGRKRKDYDEYDEYEYSEREKQEYYDSHPLKVPAGCRACGGPYPSCCDNCPMFDD